MGSIKENFRSRVRFRLLWAGLKTDNTVRVLRLI